jgi:ORF6N domain
MPRRHGTCTPWVEAISTGVNVPMPISMERVEDRILSIRGHRVMIDADLAEIYGVPTKALNQAIKRNAERFPEDFAFRLTAEEKTELVTNCDRFNRLKHSTAFPVVFTEHGAIMAASVLNSPRAIQASVYVVRAFVKMRVVLASHKELVRRLDEMEGKVDRQFKVVFDAIRALMEPPAKPGRRIGY